MIASQHSVWHRGKTKWKDDKRSLGLFVFLVDQTGLELARPPCKGHRQREVEEAFQEKNDGSEQDSSFL